MSHNGLQESSESLNINILQDTLTLNSRTHIKSFGDRRAAFSNLSIKGGLRH